ncbi:hypothetical protein CYLTODRAFT_462333, partial [Cylindrobasidium torrendii FP15055 ss-10]
LPRPRSTTTLATLTHCLASTRTATTLYRAGQTHCDNIRPCQRPHTTMINPRICVIVPLATTTTTTTTTAMAAVVDNKNKALSQPDLEKRETVLVLESSSSSVDSAKSGNRYFKPARTHVDTPTPSAGYLDRSSRTSAVYFTSVVSTDSPDTDSMSECSPVQSPHYIDNFEEDRESTDNRVGDSQHKSAPPPPPPQPSPSPPPLLSLPYAPDVNDLLPKLRCWDKEAKARGFDDEFLVEYREHLANYINRHVPACFPRKAQVVDGELVKVTHITEEDMRIMKQAAANIERRKKMEKDEEDRLSADGTLFPLLAHIFAAYLFCVATRWCPNVFLERVPKSSRGLTSLVHCLETLIEYNGADSITFVYAFALIRRLFLYVHIDTEGGWSVTPAKVTNTFNDMMVGAFRIAQGVVHDKERNRSRKGWASCLCGSKTPFEVEFLWMKALDFQMHIPSGELAEIVQQLTDFSRRLLARQGQKWRDLTPVSDHFWTNAWEKLPEDLVEPLEGFTAPEPGTGRMQAIESLVGELCGKNPLVVLSPGEFEEGKAA